MTATTPRTLTVELPYPAKMLWPNSRPGHWSQVRKPAKAARCTANICAREALAGVPWGAPTATLAIVLHPKAQKRNGARNTQTPDRDNITAALKAAIDGIADALGIDDRNITTLPPVIGERVPHGLVRVTITIPVSQQQHPQPQ